jgi:hypothetical protein
MVKHGERPREQRHAAQQRGPAAEPEEARRRRREEGGADRRMAMPDTRCVTTVRVVRGVRRVTTENLQMAARYKLRCISEADA